MQEPLYDVLGVGIGPFNLSLAALSAPLTALRSRFLEAEPHFDWHPGLLLDDCTMQTPFMADLVTLADPTSRYSFLNFAKQQGHLYAFCIRENFFLLRREYNRYCQWVAGLLPNVGFGERVEAVSYEAATGHYRVQARSLLGEIFHYRARRLVLGTGTAPWLPPCSRPLAGALTHSADYLPRRERLMNAPDISVLGSGQSAAEIFYDLLRERPRRGYRLSWFTRSPHFFPLEYNKLTLELTSPDYIDYFHGLPEPRRALRLDEQKNLYKGINRSLLNAIYDELYQQRLAGLPDCSLSSHCELFRCALGAGGGFELDFHHREQGRPFRHACSELVMATGYSYRRPAFMEGIAERLRLDDRGRLAVARNYSVDVSGGEIFVQNAELHTHGFTAPDLSMACYRNSVILRELLGYEPYPVENRIAFQRFGAPPSGLRLETPTALRREASGC